MVRDVEPKNVRTTERNRLINVTWMPANHPPGLWVGVEMLVGGRRTVLFGRLFRLVQVIEHSDR